MSNGQQKRTHSESTQLPATDPDPSEAAQPELHYLAPANEPMTAASDAARSRFTNPWHRRLLPGFVVFTLLALLVAPVVVRLHTGTLRQRSNELVEPAQDLVNELQLSLAVGMSLLRGYELSEEDVFLVTYEDVLERERHAFDELESYIKRLSPETQAKYREFKSDVDDWRARVTEAEIVQQKFALDADDERLPRQQVHYEKALSAAMDLRTALLEEAERNQDAIESTERAGMAINVLLVLLALSASVIVFLIARELRGLAQDADRERALAERAGQSKARVIRGISHDLRNPLAVAHMAANLLGEAGDSLTEKQRRCVARLQRSLDSMVRIIDDLLEVAVGKSGEIVIRRVPTDVAEIVRNTAEDHATLAEQKGLSLELHVADSLPAIDTDPLRVREILGNLLSNALKYTPAGGRVEVHSKLQNAEEAPRPGSWLTVDVRDSGPGIPEQAQEVIFNEYARLDSREQGLGIGLSISRRIAEQLEGHLTVASRPNQGATFTLWLPVKAA